MTREQATLLVIRIVRERTLNGDDERELPLDATLAELGFDSLALVSVVSGLEAETGRAFPPEYWEERQTLHIADLIDAVERFSPDVEPPTSPAANRPAPAPAAEERRERSLGRAVLATIARRIFSRLDVVIVERLLLGELPRPAPPPGVVLRPATIADVDSLAALWPRALRGRKLRQFRSWLADGYTCLGAFDGEQAIAVDWLNETDDHGAVAAVEGTCLGIYLHERPDRSRQGVGLALLAYSLEVSHDAGYERQAAYVASDNTRMRVACTSLLGFSEVGSARRTTSFGRTRWTWQLRGGTGSGPVLLI